MILDGSIVEGKLSAAVVAKLNSSATNPPLANIVVPTNASRRYL